MPEELIVSDGLNQGHTWGTYRRTATGALHRVVSKHLPLRDTREEALTDLRNWLGKRARRGGNDGLQAGRQLDRLNAREAADAATCAHHALTGE